MLDWQQTSKAKSLSVDTYIEEVGPRPSRNLDNKVHKKTIFGACENPLKQQTAFLCLTHFSPVSHFYTPW